MKNDVYQIFRLIGAFGGRGGEGAITLLKIGVYIIFKKFFH